MIGSVEAGSTRVLFAVGLAIAILAAPATPRAAAQNGQNGGGRWATGRNGQNNANATVPAWQLNKLATIIQNKLQHLTIVAQSGQLNNTQLQTVNQHAAALQSALQQLTTALQNNTPVTRAQLETLVQQLRSAGVNLPMGHSSGRR